MKEYEIWIGSYHLGQGYSPPKEPELIAKEKGINFKVACFKYELKSMLESCEKQEVKNGYVDSQSMNWFYNQNTNSNSWSGKYYETKEEALKSFNYEQ